MPWERKTSTPEEIAEELKLNLQGGTNNARVLMLGTEMPDGRFTMRLSIENPEAVAGIIYNHAIKVGEVDEALTMCHALHKIAQAASKLILDEIQRRKLNN